MRAGEADLGVQPTECCELRLCEVRLVRTGLEVERALTKISGNAGMGQLISYQEQYLKYLGFQMIS